MVRKITIFAPSLAHHATNVTHFIDMANKKTNYSFKPGWEKIPLGKAREVKDKIIAIIGCQYGTEFYRKMKSWVDIPERTYREINEVFSEYGLTPYDVWNIEDVKTTSK